jgi:hypothetical protein
MSMSQGAGLVRDGPVSVYRADARTLRVRWQGRQEHMLFRDRARRGIATTHQTS